MRATGVALLLTLGTISAVASTAAWYVARGNSAFCTLDTLADPKVDDVGESAFRDVRLERSKKAFTVR